MADVKRCDAPRCTAVFDPDRQDSSYVVSRPSPFGGPETFDVCSPRCLTLLGALHDPLPTSVAPTRPPLDHVNITTHRRLRWIRVALSTLDLSDPDDRENVEAAGRYLAEFLAEIEGEFGTLEPQADDEPDDPSSSSSTSN